MCIMLIVNQMIQLFIMIIIGYGMGKTSLFHSNFNQKLTQFVLNLVMPCMIVASVMSSNTTSLALFDILKATFILIILLPIVSNLCIRFLPISHKGLYMFMMMFPNVGFMGFPLMKAIFGNESLLSTAVINMGFNLSLFTLGAWVMNYDQKENTKFYIKDLLSPGVIASLAALLIYAMNISFPQVVSNPISLIGDMTTPLAMLIIGATLSQYKMKDVFLDFKVYLFALIIDFVIPILFYPLIHMIINDAMIQGITLIILAMPVANGAVLFAKNYNQNEFLAAKTVFISTLMSIITIPILVYLFLYK